MVLFAVSYLNHKLAHSAVCKCLDGEVSFSILAEYSRTWRLKGTITEVFALGEQCREVKLRIRSALKPQSHCLYVLEYRDKTNCPMNNKTEFRYSGVSEVKFEFLSYL